MNAARAVRRVVIDAPGALRIETAALRPTPAPGTARVRPVAIGVCGSDVHVFGGHHPFVTYPVFPGHEVVGEVEAVGTEVDPDWVGRRVVLEPGLACGTCRTCRRGDVHLCGSLRVMGFQAPGGMADAFDADLDRLHVLPDGVATEQGALVEPLAVATHAVRLAGDVAGRDVLVLGAGTIGVVCALVARADGARVHVVDPSLERRAAVAAAFGLELAAEAPVDAFDVVFECVGVEAALRDGVVALRKGGTLMVVGVHGQDARVQAGWIQDRELRLQGTLMYQRADVVRAIDLMATEAFDLSAMVGARYPLAEARDAFVAAGAGGAVLKVLLIP